ncbi:MAG: proteasome assembly chaperone family protein [Candidatus Diapherotrites archaeon]|nr:proteasome assembly chaperone family protein [Candidatus Diapherotrites archaeon]
MEEFEVVIEKEVKLNKPILIEGLPGLGLVGKIAVEHIVKELKAEKLATMYSVYFPPQVVIQEDGTVRLMKNEFYYWKSGKKSQRDLLFIIGDTQGSSPESHYKLCNKILDVAEMYNSDMVYTLGGFGVGHMVKKPKVFGAVTHKTLLRPLKQVGVSFEKTGGGIIGAAGLLLGLGKLRDMKGVCLMGETHGQIIDARSAKAVIDVIGKILKVDIDTKELDKRAKETEKALKRVQKLEKQRMSVESFPMESESPSYIR